MPMRRGRHRAANRGPCAPISNGRGYNGCDFDSKRDSGRGL